MTPAAAPTTAPPQHPAVSVDGLHSPHAPTLTPADADPFPLLSWHDMPPLDAQTFATTGPPPPPARYAAQPPAASNRDVEVIVDVDADADPDATGLADPFVNPFFPPSLPPAYVVQDLSHMRVDVAPLRDAVPTGEAFGMPVANAAPAPRQGRPGRPPRPGRPANAAKTGDVEKLTAGKAGIPGRPQGKLGNRSKVANMNKSPNVNSGAAAQVRPIEATVPVESIVAQMKRRMHDQADGKPQAKSQTESLLHTQQRQEQSADAADDAGAAIAVGKRKKQKVKRRMDRKQHAWKPKDHHGPKTDQNVMEGRKKRQSRFVDTPGTNTSPSKETQNLQRHPKMEVEVHQPRAQGHNRPDESNNDQDLQKWPQHGSNRSNKREESCAGNNYTKPALDPHMLAPPPVFPHQYGRPGYPHPTRGVAAQDKLPAENRMGESHVSLPTQRHAAFGDGVRRDDQQQGVGAAANENDPRRANQDDHCSTDDPRPVPQSKQHYAVPTQNIGQVSECGAQDLRTRLGWSTFKEDMNPQPKNPSAQNAQHPELNQAHGEWGYEIPNHYNGSVHGGQNPGMTLPINPWAHLPPFAVGPYGMPIAFPPNQPTAREVPDPISNQMGKGLSPPSNMDDHTRNAIQDETKRLTPDLETVKKTLQNIAGNAGAPKRSYGTRSPAVELANNARRAASIWAGNNGTGRGRAPPTRGGIRKNGRGGRSEMGGRDKGAHQHWRRRDNGGKQGFRNAYQRSQNEATRNVRRKFTAAQVRTEQQRTPQFQTRDASQTFDKSTYVSGPFENLGQSDGTRVNGGANKQQWNSAAYGPQNVGWGPQHAQFQQPLYTTPQFPSYGLPPAAFANRQNQGRD